MGIASNGQEYPPIINAGVARSINTCVAFKALGNNALINTPKKLVAIMNNPVVTA
ncbi:hypothetical protein D3C78_1715650 [compost metagenome]